MVYLELIVSLPEFVFEPWSLAIVKLVIMVHRDVLEMDHSCNTVVLVCQHFSHGHSNRNEIGSCIKSRKLLYYGAQKFSHGHSTQK